MVSGNVSLYNDTGGTGIDPTVVIGMVGVIDDVARPLHGRISRPKATSSALVGPVAAELDGSEYQRIAHGVNRGHAATSSIIDLERRVQAFVLEAISERASSTPRTTAQRAASRSRSPSRVCWAT